MTLVFSERFLSRSVLLQIDRCPLHQGHTLYLVLIVVFSHTIAVLVFCPFYASALEGVPCWPDTPDALPVFQANVIAAGPLACGGLVAPFIEMFLDTFFFHTH